MAEPVGGRPGYLAYEDEFEEAFARLTGPVADVSVPEPTDRRGAPSPAPTPTVTASGTSVNGGPSSEVAESAVAEATARTSQKRDLDGPESDRRQAGVVGHADGTQSPFGAALVSGGTTSGSEMSDGLRLLFSPPRASSEPPLLGESMTDSGHSSYYRAFIRSALRGYVISSGYERLDDLLGGGFGPGLYLLSGHRPAMRRAFLDNLVWGAVEQERSIWYYALDTSTQSVWERLIVTFGSLLGEPVLPEELRASTGVDDVAARVGRIDAALVTNVFPHVRLRGMVGLDWGNSHRFLAGLDARLCAEDSPRMLAIDSLFQLFPLRGGDTVQEARLVGELDRILRARSAAAVATVPANPDARLLSAVRGHVRLSVFGDSDDGPSRNVLVTARLEDGVKSDVFSVDGVTGLLG